MRTPTRAAAIMVAAALSTTLVTACGSHDNKDEASPSTTAASSTAASSTAETTTETTDATTPEASTTTETSAMTSNASSTGVTTSSAAAAQPAAVPLPQLYVGSVDFPVKPTRVVAMGQMAVDNLLSLGIKPTVIVGVAREKNIPWQTDKGIADVPFVEVPSFNDVNIEKVASYKPELIVASPWWVGSKQTYTRLSAIAPTLGPAAMDVQAISWRTQLGDLGKIYQVSDKANQVIAADKVLFTQARAAMPGLAGKTAIASQFIGSINAFGVIAEPTLPAAQIFSDLGMTLPPAITSWKDREAGRATVPAENIDSLNADFAVFNPRGASVAQMEAVPGFKALKEVKSGAVFIADHEYQLQAINQPTALSRAYVLRMLTPKLEAVAKG